MILHLVNRSEVQYTGRGFPVSWNYLGIFCSDVTEMVPNPGECLFMCRKSGADETGLRSRC